MLGRPPIRTDDSYIRSAYLDFADLSSMAERESARSDSHVSIGTIMNRVRAMGIARQRGGVCKRLTALTQNQHEVIEGLLISDASLSRRRETPTLTLASIKQEFVDFVEETLRPLTFSRNVVPPKEYRINGKAGRTHTAYYAFSRADRALVPYWERWYGDQTKHIPGDFRITPLTARFWYYGDGSASTIDYTQSRGYRIQQTTPVIVTLCTDAFTFEDCDRLCSLWRLACSEIDFHVQRSVVGNPQLRSNKTSTIRAFFNYLGTPELKCFAYKWKLPEDRRYGGLGSLGRELVDNHVRAMSSVGMSNFKIAESLERNNIVNEDGNIRWCSTSVKVARSRLGLPATKYENSLWTDAKIRRQIAIEYWTESRPQDILAVKYSVSTSVVRRACSKFKP